MVQQIESSQQISKTPHIFFVGREHEQQMYTNFLAQATPWLFLITAEPGSGKSTLLRHLAAQTEESIPVILLDFAQPWLRTDILTILEKLAGQLQQYCDATSFKIFKQKLVEHRQALAELGKKMNQMIMAAEQAYREQMHQVVQAKTKYREQEQAIEEVVKAFYTLTETFQPERLVVLLDTSEWLYDPGENEMNRVGEWIMNSLLPELHQHMQDRDRHCHFVITSRNRLPVNEKRRQDVIEHPLPPLEQAEVERYLQQKGMQDPALCKQVYAISHGHPFSMMLIAELWQRQKEPPASFLTFLDEHQGLDMPALRDSLAERLLDKNLAEPLNDFTRYGALLRKFDLPMLQKVFPECFSAREEPQRLTQLIPAAYILPRGEYYAFDDLMRETLATQIRKHEPGKWGRYHERARNYLAKFASRHGTPYPVDGYYHALAANEKSGMDGWVYAVRKAYADGIREVLGALFLVAYDRTLDLSPAACAVVAYEQGHFYYADQQWDEALKYYRRALDRYSEAEDATDYSTKGETTTGQAKVYVGMADVQRFRTNRDLEAALDYYKRAYDLYLSIDDGGVDCYLAQAHRLYEIGEVLRLQEKMDEALERYNEALKIFQAFGYHRDIAYVHRSMGDALMHLSPDQQKEAIEHFQQALSLLPGEGDPAARAEMCAALGNLYRECQNWIEAAQAYEQGLRFYQQDENLAGQAEMCQSLGDIKKKAAQENVALDYYGKALKLYAQHEGKDLRDHTTEHTDYVTVQTERINIYWAINEIQEELHQYDGALNNCQEAEKIYDRFGDKVKAKVTKQKIDDTIERIRQIQTKWTAILYESDRKVNRDLVDTLINCEERGDDIGAAYTCQNIAQVLWGRGEELKLVLEAYHRARWYYGKVGDDGGQAYTAQKIGEIEKSLGDTGAAIKAFDEARAFYGKKSDDRGEAYAAQQKAEILRELGDLQAALKTYHEACHFYGKAADQQGQAYISQRMGELERSRGNSLQAMSFFGDAYEHYCQAGDKGKGGEAYILRLQGEIEKDNAQWPEAQKHFETAREIYQQLEDRLAEAYSCRVIGDVLLAQQRWEEALHEYNQTLSLYTQEKVPAEEARVYQGRGLAHRKSGQHSLALHDYRESARLCHQIRDFEGEAAAQRAIQELSQKPEHERSSLSAFARIRWEDNEKAIVSKTYVLQVCLGQKPVEESASQESAPEPSAVENTLIIGVELDINGVVITPQVLIRYSPLKPQWIDIPFRVPRAGGRDSDTLNVAFSHKRWLGTISFEFQALEYQEEPNVVSPQWTERHLDLPLYDKFRVDVFLYVRRIGNRYTVQIFSDRAAVDFSTDALTDYDVSTDSANLQKAIEGLLVGIWRYLAPVCMQVQKVGCGSSFGALPLQGPMLRKLPLEETEMDFKIQLYGRDPTVFPSIDISTVVMLPSVMVIGLETDNKGV